MATSWRSNVISTLLITAGALCAIVSCATTPPIHEPLTPAELQVKIGVGQILLKGDRAIIHSSDGNAYRLEVLDITTNNVVGKYVLGENANTQHSPDPATGKVVVPIADIVSVERLPPKPVDRSHGLQAMLLAWVIFPLVLAAVLLP